MALSGLERAEMLFMHVYVLYDGLSSPLIPPRICGRDGGGDPEHPLHHRVPSVPRSLLSHLIRHSGGYGSQSERASDSGFCFSLHPSPSASPPSFLPPSQIRSSKRRYSALFSSLSG